MSDPFAPGFLPRLDPPPARVAILRTSRIGDFIVATPALRSLRAALPHAEFTLIGLPFLAELAARSPHLDHFVEFPGYPGMAEQFFDARRAARFFEAMQREDFDLAIQLNGSGVYSNPFALMLGARHTAGWVRPGEGSGRLDAALPWPELGHEIDKALSLPLFLGAPFAGRLPEFPLGPEDHGEAEQLLRGARRPLIGLHPAAREITKRWPPERFAEVAVALHRRTGGSAVILGGPEEVSLGRAVMVELRARDPAAAAGALDLAGRTSLGGLGAVLDRLSVLITNDSGPAHIAYALGTPAVTIFGATDPARWGPSLDSPAATALFRTLETPLPCWPCDRWVCPHTAEEQQYACLRGISPGRVLAAAEEVLR